MSVFDRIVDADRSAFLAINGAHTPALDHFMWYASDLRVWIPLYAFFLAMIKVRWGWRGLWWSLPLIALMLVLSDTGSVVFFKNTVQRLRPSHAPELVGLVHLVTDPHGELYRGGLFGFISSHASNHFAIAAFMTGMLQRRPRWSGLLLLLWASLVAISRVFLGVHYPGDVIVGALYGTLIGSLAFLAFMTIHQRSRAT